MPAVTIDGRELGFEPGESVITVADRNGIHIPRYCWHSKLSVAANCRMCLIEVEKAPKLLPACQTDCRDGMVVHTKSERVREAQRAVLEFILINHPLDCPICDQAGECKLQDYYMDYDLGTSRMRDPKVEKPRLEHFGPYVIYNGDRCILCTRCVRFMEEVAKERQLGIVGRGDHAHIATFPGRPLDNPYSLNVVDLCPVGALTSAVFRFKQRVWNLSRSPSLCPGCARGCNIHVDERSGLVYRLLPRENEAVNACWMCDEGRLSYRQANDDRITQGLIRNGATDADSGEHASDSVAADEALDRAVGLLAPIAQAKSGLCVALSMRVTCEDAYVTGRVAKEVLGAQSVAVLGYENGASDDQLRLADKNPNRAGIERVLSDLGLTALDRSALEDGVQRGSIKAVLCVGHEVTRADDLAELLAGLEVVVHVAHARSPLAQCAHATLPSVPWVQADGTWINAKGRAQRLYPGFKAQGGAREAHSWLMELAARLGVSFALPSPQTIRAEMERQLSSFGPSDLTDVGPEGKNLS